MIDKDAIKKAARLGVEKAKQFDKAPPMWAWILAAIAIFIGIPLIRFLITGF